LKKGVELKSAHGSPPSRRVDAKCLVIDGLCYLASRQDRIRTAFAQRGFSLYQIELPTASEKFCFGLRFGKLESEAQT
jgi:hypothetical protein